MQGVLAVSLFVMLFVAVAEWLFWDEFGVRFNFIAVDYLVYSKEVLDNIRESYPLPTLLGSLAVAAVVLCLLLRKPCSAHCPQRLPTCASAWPALPCWRCCAAPRY
jgi:hypothetical protein